LKRAARVNQGSIVFNRRFGTWNFLWCERGHRRSKVLGTAREFPTKASAWQAAAPLRRQLEESAERCAASNEPALTMRSLIEHYRVERMPRRAMTRQGYNTWLNHYIIPTWGDCALQQLQARPVDLWLRSLALSPKSKVHIRGLLRILWEFAMWRGDIPLQRNPMELVTVMVVDFAQIETAQKERRATMEQLNPPHSDHRKEYNQLKQKLFELKQDAKAYEIRTNEAAGQVRLVEQRINEALKLKKAAVADGNLRGERTYEHAIQSLEAELVDAQEQFEKNKRLNAQAARALKAFDGHARMAELKKQLEADLPGEKAST
jgi:hypothetical protein